jgi:hypothetical protein
LRRRIDHALVAEGDGGAVGAGLDGRHRRGIRGGREGYRV